MRRTNRRLSTIILSIVGMAALCRASATDGYFLVLTRPNGADR